MNFFWLFMSFLGVKLLLDFYFLLNIFSYEIDIFIYYSRYVLVYVYKEKRIVLF